MGSFSLEELEAGVHDCIRYTTPSVLSSDCRLSPVEYPR